MAKGQDFYNVVPSVFRTERNIENSTPYALASAYADKICKEHDFASRIGKPNPSFVGREREVGAVVESLYKKRMRNCVLVGDAGIGKTEIAKKAIAKFGKKEVFLSIDPISLLSGCTLVGTFEGRFSSFLDRVTSWNANHEVRISLFADEIHVLWRMNEHEGIGTVSAGNALKPLLADGLVTVIGATTNDEYRRFVERDKALLRRISPIFVGEMGDEETLDVVRGFCGGELNEEMVSSCIERSHGVPYLRNPDCSIEIADRLMAKAICAKRKPSMKDLDEVMSAMLGGIVPKGGSDA